MYGRRFARELPRLRNYQAAVEHEAKVVPIRRDPNEPKPLGARSHKWVTIRKVDEEIRVSMGGTDFLIFHPDDTITLKYDTRWSAASINEITTYVLGIAVYTVDHRVWARCQADGVWGLFPVRTGSGEHSRFKIVDGEAVYLNPLFCTTYRKKRKEANACYKQYADFRKFLYGVIKLRGETPRVCGRMFNYFPRHVQTTEFTSKEYEEYFGADVYIQLKKYCAELTHATMHADMFKAVMALMWQKPFTVAAAKNELEKYVCRTNAETIFEIVTHTDGKIHKDKYRRFLV